MSCLELRRMLSHTKSPFCGNSGDASGPVPLSDERNSDRLAAATLVDDADGFVSTTPAKRAGRATNL